jgi:CRP/FNR family transcriptional regulator, dissimilatory nitrate respiration regulator
MASEPDKVDMEVLEKTFLFEELPAAAHAALLAGARTATLQDGQYLFRQGEAANRFYVVVAGRIGISRMSPAGDEKVVEIIGAGQTFAEALMFMGVPRYPVNARAIGATRLVGLHTGSVSDVLRGSTALCLRLMANMSLRLHRLLGEVEALTLQSATGRIVDFLLGLVQEGAPGATAVALPAPKQLIASRLSIKPETLSRALHELAAQGLIAVDGSLVEIRDVEALARYAR